MGNSAERTRRCNNCRKIYPKCDLFNHRVHGYLCKSCYKSLK